MSKEHKIREGIRLGREYLNLVRQQEYKRARKLYISASRGDHIVYESMVGYVLRRKDVDK